MPDHFLKHGAQDGERVSGNERYEVECIAREHGISQVLARELVWRHGIDPEKLSCEAEKAKAELKAR